MTLTLVRSRLLASAVIVVAGAASAQNAAPRPQLHVIKDVRLSDEPDAPRKSIVLRDGRIEAVLDASAPTPIGAREIEGKGMLAVPAFVDAYTLAGCATPTPVADKDAPPSEASSVQIDMREANRKGIQPAFRAAEVLDLPKDKSKTWRENGFGALVSSPAGQLLAGTSVLATTRDAAARDTVLAADLFAHAAFRAGGSGYPSTLMGYHAQLRQFFLDVAHHTELLERYRDGRPGPRPPFDAELEAGAVLARRGKRVMCEAESAQDIRRWIRLADELGLDIGIVGGREAWKVADLLKARGIPLVLTLDWGEEPKDPHEKDKKAKKPPTKIVEAAADAPVPDGASGPKETDAKSGEAQVPAAQAPATLPAQDEKPDAKADEPEKTDEAEKSGKRDKREDVDAKWTYEEPLGVREEKRRVWEEGRDCARALTDANVAYSLGSAGNTGAELLKKVRTMVEHGLPADAALAALTTGAAAAVGAERHLGRIEPGFDASLALWTGNPTAKDAKVAWLFVDGFSYEFEIKVDAKVEGKPDEGVNPSGKWTIELRSAQGPRAGTLEITMTPEGDVTGTMTTTGGQGGERTLELKGHVGGKSMSLEGTFTMRETEVTQILKLELSGDSFSGTATSRGPWGESTSDVVGERAPGAHEGHQAHDGRSDDGESDEEACCDHP
jgi:imidazolonepropionase-like amidohydrolase